MKASDARCRVFAALLFGPLCMIGPATAKKGSSARSQITSFTLPCHWCKTPYEFSVALTSLHSLKDRQVTCGNRDCRWPHTVRLKSNAKIPDDETTAIPAELFFLEPIDLAASYD